MASVMGNADSIILDGEDRSAGHLHDVNIYILCFPVTNRIVRCFLNDSIQMQWRRGIAEHEGMCTLHMTMHVEHRLDR